MDWFKLRNTLLTVAGIWRQFEEIAFFVILRETRLWFRSVINRARIVDSRCLGQLWVRPVHLDRFEMYKEFVSPGTRAAITTTPHCELPTRRKQRPGQ
jgi:hypothetical protein